MYKYIGRHSHSSVVLSDDSVILMGGAEPSGVFSNQVWKLSNGGFTWTLLTDKAWGTDGGKSKL